MGADVEKREPRLSLSKGKVRAAKLDALKNAAVAFESAWAAKAPVAIGSVHPSAYGEAVVHLLSAAVEFVRAERDAKNRYPGRDEE